MPYTLALVTLIGFGSFSNKCSAFYRDAVVEEISSIIRRTAGPNDIMCRPSMDEFVIYMPYRVRNTTEIMLWNIQREIEKLYAADDADNILHCCIGASENTKMNSFEEAKDRTTRAAAASFIDRFPNVVFCNDIIDDVEARAAYIGYEHRHDNDSRDEITSGYKANDSIISFSLNLFEKTGDINSALRILFCKAGRMLGMDRIYIGEFNNAMNSAGISLQWTKPGIEPMSYSAIQLSQSEYSQLIGSYGENGFITADKDFYLPDSNLYDHISAVRTGGVIYSFLLSENGVPFGNITFESSSRKVDEETSGCLRELVKIVAAYILKSRTSLESRAKSNFLSRMSHEIRTPMNAIIGMTAIALASDKTDSATKQCLEKIDRSAQYLLSLINDILDMSRIESGKMTVEYARFNINTVIEQLDAMIRVQTDSKNIYFNVDNRIRHPEVIGDQLKINQILINILGNAVKFTSVGGITFTITESDCDIPEISVLRFSIRDTGIGISHENIGRIFNSFEQADLNTPRKYGGTGLGLAISSNLVHMLGGTLELESELNEGSEFFFSIPFRKVSEAPAAQATKKAERVVDFKSKRVLVVEDDELNVEIATTLLSLDGVITEAAENGKLAVDKFERSRIGFYDAILMDIRMPVMDGLTASRHIRALDRADASTVPIIAMTANAFDEDMQKSIESGMNGHLSKPIDMNKVREILRKVWG